MNPFDHPPGQAGLHLSRVFSTGKSGYAGYMFGQETTSFLACRDWHVILLTLT